MKLRSQAAAAAVFSCAFLSALAAPAPQPIDSFARRPQMHGVTISADGRYVAFLSGSGDDTVLMTLDRKVPGSVFKRVTASEPNKFDIAWCRWANDKRVICGLSGNSRGKKYAEPPFKRLFAVNGDGSELKVLEESRNEANLLVTSTSARNVNMNYGAQQERGNSSFYALAQSTDGMGGGRQSGYQAGIVPARQDEVIDFTPDDPDTVLIELDDDRDSYRSIFSLDIYTGARSIRLAENPPMSRFITDGKGNPRIGWGTADNVNIVYYARLAGDTEWRKLGAANAFSATSRLRPIAMAEGANAAYALGNYQGRDALWSIDLADKSEPKLLFQHPLVDVAAPILRSDRGLLGMRYDVERPFVWYAEPKLTELIKKLEVQFPNRVQEVVDASADMKTLVVRFSSDTDAGTYYLYDMEKNNLQKLGSAYPELNQSSIGYMTNIVYKASDGVEIPGYLTVPNGAEKKSLPLIVMPHDGPMARDSWTFDFLRTFLANRGYAVLQMNYRGSTGFGREWQLTGQQQWGGRIYGDVLDATKWAISEGLADPKRVCIMGWGFGGYAALLGAARNGDTFKCAVSINGIADPALYTQQGLVSGDEDLRRAMIGTDKEQLKLESPMENAANVNIPVLLVHGTRDWQVQVDQTYAMSKALDKADKPYEQLIIKDAGHDLDRKSDRVELLNAVEEFLKDSIGGAK